MLEKLLSVESKYEQMMAEMADPAVQADTASLRPAGGRRDLAAVVEDVEDMAAAGESLAGAAARLGLKESTLKEYLRDAGRRDLTDRLRADA